MIATRTGRILRVNSDLIAAELASSLEASKLIFLTSHPGLSLRGEALLNVPAEDLRETLARNPAAIQPELLSKVECSLMALGRGTPRAHILDGRIFGALLTEVFDKVGLGTMIHSNDYDRIRPATPADSRALHNLIRNAAAGDGVRERSIEAVEEGISDFHLYEIDGSLVACAALLPYPGSESAELACVFVQPFYQGRGVGLKMVRYAEREARGARIPPPLRPEHPELRLLFRGLRFRRSRRRQPSPGPPGDSRDGRPPLTGPRQRPGPTANRPALIPVSCN